MPNVLMAAATVAALLSGTAIPSAASAGADPLAKHLWRERILVALAPSASDPGLAAQRRLFEAMSRGARERDLVLVEAVDGTPDGMAFRKRFGGSGFRAVLIGKDGGDKLTADHPIGPEALFPLIDSMPMRQEEMLRR